MTTKSTQTVLRQARNKVAKGWCQGAEFDGKNYCALGAVDASTTDLNELIDALDIFAGAVDTDRIGIWNDRPERTKTQVLAAFDAAISIAKTLGA